MELSKNYIPNKVEANWYEHWLSKGYFNSVPDQREPYTIVIPPPNVTGVLHMGHCLNNTIQDILIRYARMHGKNACWVPGTVQQLEQCHDYQTPRQERAREIQHPAPRNEEQRCAVAHAQDGVFHAGNHIDQVGRHRPLQRGPERAGALADYQVCDEQRAHKQRRRRGP